MTQLAPKCANELEIGHPKASLSKDGRKDQRKRQIGSLWAGISAEVLRRIMEMGLNTAEEALVNCCAI